MVRRLPVALVIVLLALASPAVAVAAPAWQPPLTLSAVGQDAELPELAFDPQGRALVLWQRSGPAFGIQAVQYGVAAGFGLPQTISDLGGEPQVAFDAQGNAIAVWQRRSSGPGGGCSVCAEASFRPVGGGFGLPERVPPAGAHPRLAVDAAGNALVVVRHPGGVAKPLWASYRPAGASFGPGRKLAGGQTGVPEIAYDSRGRATALWSRGVRVQSALARPAGAFGRTQNVAPGDLPALAVDRRGNALAVFRRGIFPRARVRAAFLPPGGRFRRPQTLSGPDAGDETDAAFDRRGNALAIWWRRNRNGNNFRVQVAYKPAGRRFRRAGSISPFAKRVVEPQVAFDRRGNALALWWQEDRRTRRTRVQAAYKPAGRPFRRPQTIAGGAEGVGSIRLGFDPRGNALAVWEELEFGQSLTPTGARIRAAAFAQPAAP